MAIIVVLAALGWVAGRAAMVLAKNASCMSRLEQIGKARHLHASDHDTFVLPMIMPTIGNEDYSQWAEGDPEPWRDCLARYAKSEEIFLSPFDPHLETEFRYGADMGTSLLSSCDTVPVTESGSLGPNHSILLSADAESRSAYVEDRAIQAPNWRQGDKLFKSFHGDQMNALWLNGSRKSLSSTD